MINLDSPDILTAQEAAKIWGKNEAYVRTALNHHTSRWKLRLSSTCLKKRSKLI